jgi:hypothetical protein
MKTDRELLELAAKAAGLVLEWDGHPDQWQAMYYEGKSYKFFEPLINDVDALRLAVSIPGLNLQWIIAEAWQAHNDLPGRMAYVRRAIVRAAAAIGEAMK